jgi:hypothetical protein
MPAASMRCDGGGLGLLDREAVEEAGVEDAARADIGLGADPGLATRQV